MGIKPIHRGGPTWQSSTPTGRRHPKYYTGEKQNHTLLGHSTTGSKPDSTSNGHGRLTRVPNVLGQRCWRAAGADEAAVDRCWDLGIRRWRSWVYHGSKPEPGPISAGPGQSRERLLRSGQKEGDTLGTARDQTGSVEYAARRGAV